MDLSKIKSFGRQQGTTNLKDAVVRKKVDRKTRRGEASKRHGPKDTVLGEDTVRKTRLGGAS